MNWNREGKCGVLDTGVMFILDIIIFGGDPQKPGVCRI